MKFTVLMPVHNTPPANLFPAFYSIYKQPGVPNYEIVIVDDGSTNIETLMALDFIGKIDGVTVITHSERMGSSAARNTGIQAIDTEYIALMDSDDISDRSRLKVQAAYMKEHKPHVLGTNLFSFYDGDLGMSRIFRTKHQENPEYNDGWLVNQGTVIFRKEAVLSVGGYNNALMRAQDIDLWKRLHKAGYVFRNITNVMYAWRRYRK